MVVSLDKRRIVADLLRQYFRQRITNDELVAKFIKDGGDKALQPIQDIVWLFYSDCYTHYMFDATRERPEVRNLFERCVLFLENDYQYEWPPLKISLLDSLRNLIGRQRGMFLSLKELTQHKDFNVWPFKTRQDLEMARLKVRPKDAL